MAGSAGSPIEWPGDGPPRSSLYGDLYYSRDDGLGESRQVFLAGCGLPDAWRGRLHFSVAELGFGTGLNIAALLELWSREGPPRGWLSLFSIEAHPVSAEDASRALETWPEVGAAARALLSRWPGRARGFHRLDLPTFRATLDIAIMEAAEALKAWSGPADAWFLDGFAPALNPAMWRPEVLGLIARRSAPGARLATYSVAGQVRRDLALAGFAVERVEGFGAKRQRLEGRRAGEPRPGKDQPRLAIVGAGIAGASLARAFRGLGAEPSVFDAAGPENAPAIAFPAALVSPRLDAGLGPQAALFAQAHARAARLYAALPGAVMGRGALQLAVGPKDERRFGTIAGSDLFEAGAMGLMNAADSSSSLGEAAPPGLMISEALVIDPSAVLGAWSGPVTRARVAGLANDGGCWRILGADGAAICEADVVCVAAGMGTGALAPGVDPRPVRGQASLARGAFAPMAVLFGGYAVPFAGGVLFGATHDRDDEDIGPRTDDDRRNLDTLAAVLPRLAAHIAGHPLEAHVGVRATTSDYLPLAGRPEGAPPGLFVLTGLGSRGFTLGPLLAEHVAALALDRPSPLPADLAALVDPRRFALRARRRGRRPG